MSNGYKEKFDQIIQDSKEILIISSKPLDYDCIASGLITKKYLETTFNKTPKLIFPKELNREELERHNFLPHFNEFITNNPVLELQNKNYDCVILLDGANYIQFATDTELPKFDQIKNVIQIDHHAVDTDEFKTTLKIKDTSVSSTIELLFKEIVNVEFINKSLATIAYAGIVGDTGNFQWAINKYTLELASKLLDKEADFELILEWHFAQKPESYLNNLQLALKYTELDKNNKCQWLIFTNEILQKEEITPDMMQEIRLTFNRNIARIISGYDIGFCLNENPDNSTGLLAIGNNFSNKKDLRKLSEYVGSNGGGHFNFIKTKVPLKIEEAKTKIIEFLRVNE